MRLSIPKLSQFFHRRSKSDPALSRRLASPPARRPLSASILEGLAHLHLPQGFDLPLDAPSGSSRSLPSELLARVPTTPVALPPSHSNPHPRPNPRPVSLATLSSTASAASSAASGASSSTTISAASHTVVVEVLTRRIQELEAELETARSPLRDTGDPSTVAGLESELPRLRARDASTPSAQNTWAERALAGPTDTQADGCTLTVRQQEGSESDTVGTRPPPESAGRAGGPPMNTDILLNLLTPCAERAMLDDAYRRVLAGDDPEDALVDAIRAAAAVHGSTWRRLLAPVVGTPAPEAYAAQVRCTLAARRETRGWRTRAAFWRASARLGGGHKETVTPSASQLSDVVRELEAGEGARKLKGKEVQPMQVRVEVSVQTQTDAPLEELEVDSDPTPRPPAVMRLGAPREKIPSVQQIFATSATNAAGSPATVAPHETLPRSLTPPRKAGTASASTSPVRTSPGAYGNLPPLASVTFRESHSISSRKELVGLSASASSSSQESRVSQKRKGVILEASSSDLQSQAQTQAQSQARVPSASSLEPGHLVTTGSLSGTGSISDSGSGAGSVAGSGSGSGLGSGTISGTGISDSGSSERTTRTDSPASTGSWDRLSSFMARSFSFGFGFGSTLQDTLAVEAPDAASGAHTAAPSTKPKLKLKADPGFTLNPNVSINNPSPTPAPTRRPDPLPKRPPPSPTPSATRPTVAARARTPSPLSSANSSPAKSPKSRLPLPVGAGTPSPTRVAPPKRTFMKRLSLAISKPVLVDSTNAAALVVGAGAGAGSGAGVAAGRYGLMQKRGAHTQTMASVKEAGTGTVGVKRRAEASPEKAKAGGKKTGGWDKGKKARVDENANGTESARQGVSQQSKGKGAVRTRLMRRQA